MQLRWTTEEFLIKNFVTGEQIQTDVTTKSHAIIVNEQISCFFRFRSQDKCPWGDAEKHLDNKTAWSHLLDQSFSTNQTRKDSARKINFLRAFYKSEPTARKYQITARIHKTRKDFFVRDTWIIYRWWHWTIVCEFQVKATSSWQEGTGRFNEPQVSLHGWNQFLQLLFSSFLVLVLSQHNEVSLFTHDDYCYVRWCSKRTRQSRNSESDKRETILYVHFMYHVTRSKI